MYNRGPKEKTLRQDSLRTLLTSLLSLSSGICLEVRSQALVRTFCASVCLLHEFLTLVDLGGLTLPFPMDSASDQDVHIEG